MVLDTAANSYSGTPRQRPTLTVRRRYLISWFHKVSQEMCKFGFIYSHIVIRLSLCHFYQVHRLSQTLYADTLYQNFLKILKQYGVYSFANLPKTICRYWVTGMSFLVGMYLKKGKHVAHLSIGRNKQNLIILTLKSGSFVLCSSN